MTQFLSDLRARLFTERGLFLVATVAVAIVFFWFFEDLVLYIIFNRSLVSADDAYFAMISRTLVTDGVYGLPHSDMTVTEFEPSIGTGPALLLPGALTIALFGAQYWAPGLTTHAVFLLQLAGVLAALSSRYGIGRALAFVTACVAIMHLMSGIRWFFPTYVGETPAFGYLLLGTALLATATTRWRLAAAGVAFGLAVSTKVIALFVVAGALIAWSVHTIRSRRLSTWLASSLIVACGGVLPALLFEFFKVLNLGLADYINHFGPQIRAIVEHGAIEEAAGGNRAQRALDVATESYLLSWRTALAAVVAAIATFTTTLGRHTKKGDVGIATMLWAGVIAFLAYYLTIGTMWDRYAALAVFAAAAAIAAPILTLRERWGVVFGAVLFVTLFLGVDLDRGFRDQSPARPEQEVVLQAIAEEPDLPIVIRSWHSGYDTLFLAPDRAWDQSARVERFRNRAFVFVARRQFTPADDPFVEDVLARCPDLGAPLPSYHLRRCGINYWNAPS